MKKIILKEFFNFFREPMVFINKYKPHNNDY
jgi:hypothetical protein